MRPLLFSSINSISYEMKSFPLLFNTVGEAKVEDLAARAAEEGRAQRAQQQFQQQQTATEGGAAAPAAVEEDDVDMEGVEPKDVDLVVGQARCSKADAVKALKNNDNDIVTAIMELSRDYQFFFQE